MKNCCALHFSGTIMASVAPEYFKIYTEYFEKYGEKRAVLMMLESFYEILGVDNETEKIGSAEELSRILNIILTRKNKKILRSSIQNPPMLGFPCLALSKYVPVLLNEDHRHCGANEDWTQCNVTLARRRTSTAAMMTTTSYWCMSTSTSTSA